MVWVDTKVCPSTSQQRTPCAWRWIKIGTDSTALSPDIYFSPRRNDLIRGIGVLNHYCILVVTSLHRHDHLYTIIHINYTLGKQLNYCIVPAATVAVQLEILLALNIPIARHSLWPNQRSMGIFSSTYVVRPCLILP